MNDQLRLEGLNSSLST